MIQLKGSLEDKFSLGEGKQSPESCDQRGWGRRTVARSKWMHKMNTRDKVTKDEKLRDQMGRRRTVVAKVMEDEKSRGQMSSEVGQSRGQMGSEDEQSRLCYGI